MSTPEIVSSPPHLGAVAVLTIVAHIANINSQGS